ncbi:hypothetical protein Dimus_027312, partial [Dionaea muscipula]
MAVINQVMRLMVGIIPFDIRVAEEHAVFICNSDFRCRCTCHEREDEQYLSTEVDEDGDDAARKEAERSLDDDSSDFVSFVADSQNDSCAPRNGSANGNVDGFLQDSGCEETREPGLPRINLEVVLGNPLVNSICALQSLNDVVPRSDKTHGRTSSAAVDRQPGEKRSRALRFTFSPTKMDYAKGTTAEQSTEGLDQTQTDLGVPSGLDGKGDDRPRKRGRPRKKNMVVKAVALAVEKSASISQGVGVGQRSTVLDLDKAIS